MRKLIKKILKENEWEWANKVEAKLTKGLILCPNHERFKGGCLKVLNVEEVKDRYAPDKMISLKDLETGNRYAETITNMMQWLSDGDYVMAYQPLKEYDDLKWIKDVKAIVPFHQVKHSFYRIEFIDPKRFIFDAEQCGVNNADDIVYETEYVKVKEKAELTSGAIYCGDGNEEHYEGEKVSLELNFYDKENKLIHSGYWVAEDEGVNLLPY